MPFLFFLPLCNHGRSKLSAENTNGIIPPSARRLAATSLYKGGKVVKIAAPLAVRRAVFYAYFAFILRTLDQEP